MRPTRPIPHAARGWLAALGTGPRHRAAGRGGTAAAGRRHRPRHHRPQGAGERADRERRPAAPRRRGGRAGDLRGRGAGDGGGGEARVSDAFRSLWGLPPEARCDFPTLLARVHPDDRAAFAAGHRRLAEAGGGFDATFRVVLPDGGLRWIRARGEASAGGDGAPTQIRGISFNVTDRYTQEQTRRDLLQLAEGSPDLIGLATLEGRLTYLNPAGRRMLGVAPGTAAGSLVLADHLAPASQALLRTVAIPRLLEAGVWEGDMRLVQAGTGAVIETRHLASALRDPAGRPVGLACVIRDVTADRQALAARAEGEARWRGLLENLHEGVVLCELVEDAAGRAVDIRYLEINGDGWERMTGIPAAAALGRRMTEVIPDIEPAWIEAYDAVVRNGTALHFEMPVAALGRRFEVHAFPLGVAASASPSSRSPSDGRRNAPWPRARRGSAAWPMPCRPSSS
ncbi:PAS domain-containing protein [Paeniroseomonas aquatica]|uniref:PAS domain-containing protein n=1 Tax=Paeniroseomonas aquatica TaxID=373043 RepID=UPI00360BB5B4